MFSDLSDEELQNQIINVRAHMKNLEYGSDDYNSALAELDIALDEMNRRGKENRNPKAAIKRLENEIFDMKNNIGNSEEMQKDFFFIEGMLIGLYTAGVIEEDYYREKYEYIKMLMKI